MSYCRKNGTVSVLALSFYHTREPLVENQIDSCRAFRFHLFFFLFLFSVMGFCFFPHLKHLWSHWILASKCSTTIVFLGLFALIWSAFMVPGNKIKFCDFLKLMIFTGLYWMKIHLFVHSTNIYWASVMCQALCFVNTLMNKIDKVLGLAELRILWKIE